MHRKRRPYAGVHRVAAYSRLREPRRAKSTPASAPRQIPSRTWCCKFHPRCVPSTLHVYSISAARQSTIIFSRRVPAAVAAVPQSAYRTFMSPSERTCQIVRNMRVEGREGEGWAKHEDASDVRDGHLRDRDSHLYRYARVSTSTRPRIGQTRIPFTSSMPG